MATPIIPISNDFSPDIFTDKKYGKKILGELEDTLSIMQSLEKILNNKDKKQIEILEKLNNEAKAFVEREKGIAEMLEKGLFTPEQAKVAKMRNKITFEEHKREKNKFWPKMLTGIQTMSKGIAQMAGDSFMKIIGFLLAMAIFDPKGKLLGSILKFFVGIFIWFIKTLVTYLPYLVNTIIDLIFNVLPKLLKEIINSIFPKDSLFKDFALLIASLSPFLLTAWLALGGIMKLMPGLKVFGGFMWGLFGVLFPAAQASVVAFFVSLKASLLSFLTIIGPIVLIILAVAAAFYLLYRYSDKVIGFFDSLWTWFKKLGVGWKILIGVLITPLLPIIALIYGLAKFFQSVKKNGLKTTLKMIGEWFVKIKNKVWGELQRIFGGGLVGFMLSPLKAIYSLIKILSKFFPIFKPLLKVIDKIWDLITNTILKTINWIKEAFFGIVDIFSAASHYGFKKYFWDANENQKEAMTQSARLARARGTTLADVAKGSTSGARLARQDLVKSGYTFEDNKVKAENVKSSGIMKIDTTATKLLKVEESKVTWKKGNR